MQTVNVLEAKSTLSCLVEALEKGQQREIIIARNGRPAAKLVPIDASAEDKRVGATQGKFDVPDNIDAHNDEVAQLFVAGKRP